MPFRRRIPSASPTSPEPVRARGRRRPLRVARPSTIADAPACGPRVSRLPRRPGRQPGGTDAESTGEIRIGGCSIPARTHRPERRPGNGPERQVRQHAEPDRRRAVGLPPFTRPPLLRRAAVDGSWWRPSAQGHPRWLRGTARPDSRSRHRHADRPGRVKPHDSARPEPQDPPRCRLRTAVAERGWPWTVGLPPFYAPTVTDIMEPAARAGRRGHQRGWLGGGRDGRRRAGLADPRGRRAGSGYTPRSKRPR